MVTFFPFLSNLTVAVAVADADVNANADTIVVINFQHPNFFPVCGSAFLPTCCNKKN